MAIVFYRTGNLVINNAQKLDEGTYICQAESPAGVQISHVVFVDVLRKFPQYHFFEYND